MGFFRTLFPPFIYQTDYHYISEEDLDTLIPFEYKKKGVDEGWLELVHISNSGDITEFFYRMV